jgi:hypothetical protein
MEYLCLGKQNFGQRKSEEPRWAHDALEDMTE